MKAAGFTLAAPLLFDHLTVGGDPTLHGVTIQHPGDTRPVILPAAIGGR